MNKRSKGILVRFTEDERNSIKKKAQEAGYNAEAYCREMLLKGSVTPRPPAEFQDFTMALRRLGNNLNQVVALAHAKGILDVLRLNKLIDQLWDFEKYIRYYFRRAA